MKLVAHEDDRMAWRATEFAVKLVGSSVVPGQLYPIAFSLELLLEIIDLSSPRRRRVLQTHRPSTGRVGEKE